MEHCTNDRLRYGMKRPYSGRRNRPCTWWIAAIIVVLLAGCAPAQYTVNMKYVPTGTTRVIESSPQPFAVTVAAFEDRRNIKDKMNIGRVIKSNGAVVPVWPKFVEPARAVSVPIKDFLMMMGFSVSSLSPAWDLKEGSIRKEWGPLLIGGSIDELEVVSEDSLTTTKYQAKAKITIIFADARTSRIFHSVTTESSSSLSHVMLTEEKLEEQINTAISGAIDKVIDAKVIKNIIREALERTP